MNNTCDAIIIGGGIIGTATGYYLSKRGWRVYLFEKEYLTAGATGRCIGGIRQQFSTELSIKVAMEAVKKFKTMNEELGVDVEFHQGGYLFLAHSEEKKNTYLKLIELQNKMGLDVRFVDVDAVRDIVPGINTDDLLGGAHCPSDGQANPFLVVHGYAQHIARKGKVFSNALITSINLQGQKAISATAQNNETYYAPVIINAAGPHIRDVAQLVGLDVPIYPERHEALITEPIERFFDPMIVDYRADGCYFNQKSHKGSILGCYTPVPNVPGHDLGVSFEFAKEMGRRMARLIPKLATVKIMRQWSGSYEMTPDGNPILDKTDVEGFWVVGGMCGHGFMLGPEIGFLASHYIAEGKAPYDIGEFSIRRDFSRREVMK